MIKNEYEISDYRLSNCDEDELKTKYDKNMKSIKDYETHLKLLLSILNDTQPEYAIILQKELEKVRYLSNENLLIKKELMTQIKKNEDLKNKILEEKSRNIKYKKEIENSLKGRMIIEKYQMLSNLSALTTEIDDCTEKNNNYLEIVNANSNDKKSKQIVNKIDTLKKENLKLFNIINQVDLNKAFNFQSNSQRSSIFSCIGCSQDQAFSFDLSK